MNKTFYFCKLLLISIMKFDSELWTSILQYIFFVINKPTFYHVVVVRFENYSVHRWRCKDNINIKDYYVCMYILLFLWFLIRDYCSCFSDDRFQLNTAILKSDGSDVFVHILCTWWSQHLTTTCIVCTHKRHCHQTSKWPYRAETGRLRNRSSGLQLQIIGTTRYTSYIIY